MSKKAEGGKERARVLTPEKRSEIARKGAEARWSGGIPLVPRETHRGDLVIGDQVLQCAVLSDGTRVLSRSTFLKAMGMTFGGKKTSDTDGPAAIPRFLVGKSIKPFITNELTDLLGNPVEYRPVHGGRNAIGYEATLLPKICTAILEARDAKALQPNQASLAARADVLIRALAQVGIIALIDEVTGWQAERDRDDLQRLLKAYLNEEALKWVRRFPGEFFNQIYRLRGWQRPVNLHSHTPQMGKYINQLVYAQLPDGVMDQLKKLNPIVDDAYRRRYKHHQFLTEDVGHPDLHAHLIKLIGLMQASLDWEQFKELFGRVFRRGQGGTTQPLDFGD